MGGYDKRGNMVLPVTNENGMNNVTLPEVTVTPRNINLAGAVDRGRREAAPYVSTLLTGAIFGPLSVAGGYGMRNFGPKLKPVKDMAVGGNKMG